ncbi:MAG: putative DNA binding domain-containing protein [Fimbriimonadia bacterium]|nr:putative DNA binding domain-containing protein [Fimbriimonadia bacterium]
MTIERLFELIAGGETPEVEFKSDQRVAFSDTELVETVVCLANRQGGEPSWLIIGVEDNGAITGARTRHEANLTDPQRLVALIANRTRPSLGTRVWVVPVEQVEVIVIEVPPSRLPVGTSDGRYLRRAIGGDGRPACLPYHFHEMQSLQADRGQMDYSALVVSGACWDDLDPLEFERYRRTIRERRGSDLSLAELPDLELAKSIGAVEANGEVQAIRVLGLLLFGKTDSLARYIPAHEVAFQKLRGQSVEVNDFFRWSLLRIMEELDTRFNALNREKEILIGMFRQGIPDYAPAAFREAVANALIHRDYTRLGAVHIQWHEDRLEISNPGGFPEGVRLDNVLVTQPRPRSPLLADAFKRAGLVERTARGIDTIFYEQLRNGRPAPSYARSDASSVTLVIPGGEANMNFVRLVLEQARQGHTLTLDELLILNTLWYQRSLSTEEAAKTTQKQMADARSALNKLKERGLVEGRGEGKGRDWHLSASVYQLLDEPVAYSLQRGFEPEQLEKIILQQVRSQGKITRREVSELCRLSPPQATRLLKKLTQKGVLVQHGERKASWYGLP